MEFEELSGSDDKNEKNDQIHKRCEISQDWPLLNPSSTTTSVAHLVQ
jgi:hypothetical protein